MANVSFVLETPKAFQVWNRFLANISTEGEIKGFWSEGNITGKWVENHGTSLSRVTVPDILAKEFEVYLSSLGIAPKEIIKDGSI